ncbi:unnamed protein product, partial [Phaeothamnion confervicola]
ADRLRQRPTASTATPRRQLQREESDELLSPSGSPHAAGRGGATRRRPSDADISGGGGDGGSGGDMDNDGFPSSPGDGSGSRALPGEGTRAERVNQVALAVLRRGQAVSEHFARVCRLPAVIEAVVATLAEAWVAGEVKPDTPDAGPPRPEDFARGGGGGGSASAAPGSGRKDAAAARWQSDGSSDITIDLPDDQPTDTVRQVSAAWTAQALLTFLKAIVADVVAGGAAAAAGADRRAYAAVYRLFVAGAAYVRPPEKGPASPARRFLTWSGRGGGTTISPPRAATADKPKLPPRPMQGGGAVPSDAFLSFQAHMLRHVCGACLGMLAAGGSAGRRRSSSSSEDAAGHHGHGHSHGHGQDV